MKILASHLLKYKKESILAPLLKLTEAFLELLIPLLVADIIDNGVSGGDSSIIIRDFVLMIACGIAGLGFSIAGQFFSAKAATGFSSEVRSALYKKLINAPSGTTDKLGVSAMITRMTSDINQMQSGINLALRLLLRSPFVVLGAMIAAFLIDIKVAFVFAITIPILGIVVFIIMKITMPKYSLAQKKLDGVSLTARENLTGARVIRAFGAEDNETAVYTAKTADLERFQNGAGVISSLLNPLTFALVNFAIIALLYMGAIRVDAGLLTQGAVVALYDYMSQILVELVKFANLVVSISKAIACGKRVESVLATDDSMPTKNDDKISDSFIEFKDVSMRYGDGGESLSNISFKIEKGQTIGVIGGTGSGKSTLVNLIPRLYDVSSGFVAIDGRDVRSYSLDKLRKKTGIVLQKAVLFKGSIEDNIKLGALDVSDEDMKNAMDVAQATDFVESKENGVKSQVNQGGKNFSGGQRQRLSIARAIALKPEILILDDSSSALDYATDLKLRRAIASLDYNPTVMIVSQRTASVKGADKIIVLDEGKMVGMGTHEELMKSCDVYREIELSQTKEEDYED